MSRWTPAHDDMLRDLWLIGDVCSAIARKLNEAFGTTYTRNSVIGRQYRLDLPVRVDGAPVSPANVRARAKALVRVSAERPSGPRLAKRRPHGPSSEPEPVPAPPADPKPAPVPEPVPAGPVALLDLTFGMCRWIEPSWPRGASPEPTERIYCGAPRVGTTSWCACHLARVAAQSAQRRAA